MSKILFFAGSLQTGGAETAILRLARNLSLQDKESIAICALSDGELLATAQEIAPTTIAFGTPHRLSRFPYNYLLSLSAIVAFRLAFRWRRARYDFIVPICPLTNFLAIATRPIHRAKVVYWLHCNWEEARKTMLGRECFMYEFGFERADGIVSVSNGALKALAARTKDPKRTLSKACVIPNTLDPKLFSTPVTQLTGTRPPGRYRMIWVGRIVLLKRLDHSLQALAILLAQGFDIEFVIVGDGPAAEKERLKGLCKSLDLDEKVRWLGFSKSPISEIAISDVMVLSSEHEALPNVLVEAMAANVPFVAYDCPHGPREISMNGQVGYLVPNGDVQQLAQGIARALRDHEGTRLMLARAKESLSRFAPAAILSQWQIALAKCKCNPQTRLQNYLETDYHDSFFQSEQLVHSDDRKKPEVLAELCRSRRVLHIGCADWPIFSPASNLHLGLLPSCAEIFGLDKNKLGLDLLNPYCPPGSLFSDFSAAATRGPFDLVIVPDVLEHVGNLEDFLTSIGTLDAGKFVFTVPDAGRCAHLSHFFQDTESNYYHEVVHPDHNCWFTPTTLKTCIEKYSGLQVVRLTLVEHRTLMAVAERVCDVRQ